MTRAERYFLYALLAGILVLLLDVAWKVRGM